MYASETFAIKNLYEKKVVAETKMLRWMCRVMRKDRIWNKLLRNTVKIAQISSKNQEKELNWYSYIIKRVKNFVEEE